MSFNAKPAVSDEPVKSAEELIAEFDKESNTRQFTNTAALIMKIAFIIFALIAFATRFVSPDELARRSSFLGIAILLGFLNYPLYKKQSKKINFIPWYDFIFAVVASTPFFYFASNATEIRARSIMLTPLDLVMAIIGILFLFELCRRVVGTPLVVVVGAFIAYGLFIKGVPFTSLVSEIFYTDNGVFGTPLNVCSTFIVFFIIFGAFLEKTGIGTFFVDIANSIAGFSSGGPAKVAVISSALEGMYSGSSVANTVGSGSVTIPTMKGAGYKSEFAAAVEAAASTGGQIMPPIMGAAAFLMAETTGIGYSQIAIAAILPAFLYFAGIFMMIHFEAKKLGLKGLPKEAIPNFFILLLKKGYLFIPIIVLVTMMSVFNKTSAMAACMGIVATLVLMLIIDFVKYIRNLKNNKSSVIVKTLHLTLFFVPLIVFAVLFLATPLNMEQASLISGVVYILLSYTQKHSKESAKLAIDSIETGMRNTMGVTIACAMAGIIVAVVTKASIANTLVRFILPIAETNLILALLLVMISCIVLGMGVPTTANYLIMATITAPILEKMGIPILAAHMFVFYFGIVADITPPVALAAYAGSAIAKSNPIKTGVTATRLAIAAFIIPYMFVLNPKMLFVVEGCTPNVFEAIIFVITSMLGIFSISAGLERFMFRKLHFYEVIPLIVGGLLMIYPEHITDIIGFVLIAIVIVLQVLIRSKKKADRPNNQ